MKKSARYVLCLLTAALFLVGGTVAGAKTVSSETKQSLDRLSSALAEVADIAGPAVVNISTTSETVPQENPFGDMLNDPFFRRFFGDRFGHQGPARKHKTSALGSGVIVSADGYILTNNHVVKNAEEIKVVLNDSKREFKGRVVGSDSRTDLAVIKIDAKDLPNLMLGDSSKLKTGDLVVAVGNPFGLNRTVTMGIVSATGRSNVGIADLEDFIQTDAAINPGNSGGALVNASGELVGINTAIFSTNGGYMGIGFAIPSNMAKTVMDSIIKSGKVIRGWLGVTIQTLTPDLAESMNLKDREGALISGVEKDSPADKAGFKRGDLVIDFNGKIISDSTGLRNSVAATAPGTKAEVKIIRDGKELTLPITLEEFREAKSAKGAEYGNALKGVAVQDMTPELRDKLKIPHYVDGVVVTSVRPGSAAGNHVQVNDVIQEVGRKAVHNVREYDDTASTFGEKDTVLLLVYRSGGSIYITIKPQ